jgi:aminopeptidase N
LAGVLALFASGCLAGIGDPYYPNYGNGGYDVRHYDLDVRYDPATDVLQGVATIDAQATTSLTVFNLDFVGLTVHGITVNGQPAQWRRDPHELSISPTRAIRAGQRLTAVVDYSGVPEPTSNGAVSPTIEGGFFATDDGAFVAGEPESAATWFPVNDHPLDKASYTFHVTVPADVSVVANGLPIGRPRAASPGWMTYVWDARSPMASYLATIDIGHWDVRERRGSNGIRIIDAVDPNLGGIADAALAREGEMLDFLAQQFGPYPFQTAGAIVDNVSLNFALETQTRPFYPRVFFEDPGGESGGESAVVHELAHQWFGDTVSVARWQDIWLNEGFATYAEWLWLEHKGLATPQEVFLRRYDGIPAEIPFWSVVIGDPGPALLFDLAVYYRGAMTLQALRNVVRDDAFFDILRTWAREKRGGNGSTPEFIALAEKISGRQLDTLFDQWLFTPTKPPLPTAAAGQPAPAAFAATAVPARDDAITQWRENFDRRHALGAR